jgi:hypothetical protein
MSSGDGSSPLGADAGGEGDVEVCMIGGEVGRDGGDGLSRAVGSQNLSAHIRTMTSILSA